MTNNEWLRRLANDIIEKASAAQFFLVGKEAIVNSKAAGKYKGRIGIISGVMADGKHGLCVLVMIYRKGTTETLNGARETRSYWPLNDIEVLPLQTR